MTDEVNTEEKSKTKSVPFKQTTKSRTTRSEHKRAEKTFEPSNQLFQALIQNALDAIVVISPELIVRYESPSMEHLTGRKPNSRIGKNPVEFCHPEDTEKVASEFIKLLENKIHYVNIEIRFQHKDGRWLIFELVGTNLIDDPAVAGIVVNLRDISQRKQMEENLRQTEKQYRTLVETMNDGLAVQGKDGLHSYVNDRLCEMTGYSRDELIGHSPLELVDGTNRDKFKEEMRKRRKGIRAPYELDFIKKDGSRLVVNISPQIITDSEGEMVGSFGVITDITRQKEAEEKLLRSEENLEHAQAMAHLGYWEWDSSTNDVVLSKEMQRILGYNRAKAKFSGRPEIIHPDDIVKLQEAIEEVNIGNNPVVEFRFVLPTGDTKWIQAGSTYIDSDSANGGKVFGYALDITERKRIEEELRNSEETLKQAQYLAQVGSWTWNLIDNSFELSDEMRHLYGIEKREFRSLENILNKFIHPDDRETILEAAGKVLAEGYGAPLVYRIIKPDGEVRWMSATIPVVRHFDDNGNPQVMVGAVQDVTEQKQTEERLQESEEKLRTVFDSIGDGITVLDLAGNIVDVNETVLRIKGYNREDVIGRFGLDFVPEKERARAVEEMMVLLNGEVEQIHPRELALLAKDGSEIPCEASASLLRDGAGNVLGLISVERDLRERKKAEEKIRNYSEILRAMAKQLSEVEESHRHRTARELHDNIGQNLTALGINLNMIKGKLEKARMHEEQNILNDSQLLIEQTTESIRDVMANLRPPVLEDYGILTTLRWYGERFASRTGIDLTVRGEEPNPRLNADIEITLFRIYQEALTNISKHAQASNVIVNFNSKDGRQRLIIKDDGIGFDTTNLLKHAEQASWGLVIMSERAQSIDGSFCIESTPGEGTRVIIDI